MKIYLGDLAHSTVGLTNNHTPLNIGSIAAFIDQELKGEVDIRLFKDPNCLLEAMKKNPPDILGLSNYVWCQSVSEEMFRQYKEIKKDGITVWGGPNFQLTEHYKVLQCLKNRPYVDFFVPFEGERPILNIIRAVIKFGSDVRVLKTQHQDAFAGLFFVDLDGKLVSNQIGLNLEDVNAVPSPYLTGWLDKFLEDGMHPMFETQRGCPYQCTFCHTGLDYYKRGRSFDFDRTIEEIKYITKKVPDPTKSHLYITDSNFGMWPQDLKLAQWMKGHYEKTGFPLSFGTSTGKGRPELVKKTVMAHPKLTLTNSVQSLDPKVLKAIKRRNLPIDELKGAQKELDMAGKISNPEIILGLPEETKKSHIETFRKLIHDVGANIILQYTLMLLPGTNLATDEMREKYKYIVKYRLLPTQFGEYGGQKTFEIEEVSVGTKDMNYAEYLEMRELFFFVHNINSNMIYRPMIRYLLCLEEDVVAFFLYLMKKRKTLGEHFGNQILKNYIYDTEKELFDTKKEIIDFYSREENYQALLDGKMGVNLAHTYRTRVFLNTKQWSEFVCNAFVSFIRQKYGLQGNVIKIAEAINQHIGAQVECQYSFLNDKNNIPSQENPLVDELEFDIPKMFSSKMDKEQMMQGKKQKSNYEYYMRDDAITYIRSFDDQTTINLALIVLRMDRKYIFPEFKRRQVVEVKSF